MLRRRLQIWSKQICVSRQQGIPISVAKSGNYDLQQCRLLASRGGQDNRGSREMTWAELGSQTLEKLKQLPLIGGALSKILPATSKPSTQSGTQRPFGGQMSGLFGGGLMGRMMERTVGKAMEGAINSMGEQLRAAQNQASKLKQDAAEAIAANSEVRRQLGGSVQVGDAISQQSSTQVINGRMMQKTILTLPVIGSNGQRAHAQVVSTGQDDELQIEVQLPDGRVVAVGSADDVDQLPGDDEYMPKGRVMDADWREVR